MIAFSTSSGSTGSIKRKEDGIEKILKNNSFRSGTEGKDLIMFPATLLTMHGNQWKIGLQLYYVLIVCIIFYYQLVCDLFSAPNYRVPLFDFHKIFEIPVGLHVQWIFGTATWCFLLRSSTL